MSQIDIAQEPPVDRCVYIAHRCRQPARKRATPITEKAMLYSGASCHVIHFVWPSMTTSLQCLEMDQETRQKRNLPLTHTKSEFRASRRLSFYPRAGNSSSLLPTSLHELQRNFGKR